MNKSEASCTKQSSRRIETDLRDAARIFDLVSHQRKWKSASAAQLRPRGAVGLGRRAPSWVLARTAPSNQLIRTLIQKLRHTPPAPRVIWHTEETPRIESGPAVHGPWHIAAGPEKRRREETRVQPPLDAPVPTHFLATHGRGVVSERLDCFHIEGYIRLPRRSSQIRRRNLTPGS